MLEQISERIYVAPGGVNVGVILASGGRAILIDSGLNDTTARKIIRWLADIDRSISAIVTTHGHADHFGGNAFIVKRTGAEVWAPIWDEAVLRYPLFQPVVLFAGADPPDSLRGGFLLAEPSPVDHTYDAGSFDVSGVNLRAISLAGHSGNQMGIVCDDVFFCADVVLPQRVLDRYKVPYLYSVRDHLASLDRAETVDYRIAMPGHGPLLEDLVPLIATNRKVVTDIADEIIEVCSVPAAPGDILAEVLARYDARPPDPAGFYLLQPTIFAYLTYLEAEGRLEHSIADNRSLWSAAQG